MPTENTYSHNQEDIMIPYGTDYPNKTALPVWVSELNDEQRAELQRELIANERCATCDGRNDQHDANGMRPSAGCFAWNPVQQ